MLNKEVIISKAVSKKNYKQAFLLAWSKFLSYSELEKTDNLEVYDKEVMSNKLVASPKDWDDKIVLKYNEENIKKSLCVSIDIAIKDIAFNNGTCYKVYFDDIKEWLKILENQEIRFPKKSGKNDALNFYYEISDFYKFGQDRY